MIDEAKMADPSDLSPRAAIALMSLQLRSTVHEAVEAEAEADAIDTEAALWQLRSRLGPLIEDRRRALEAEVASERERAAEQIAAAHAEADRIVAAAVEKVAARVAVEEAAARAARVEAAARFAAEEAAARIAAQEAVAELPGVELAAAEPAVPTTTPVPPLAPQGEPAAAETPLFDDPMVEWAPDASEPSTPELLATPLTMPMPRVGPRMPPPPRPAVADGERPALHVVIDAESFARAFAAALAPSLENRQAPYQPPPQGWMPYQAPSQLPPQGWMPYQAPSQLPPQGWMPYQAPTPKKSFWSHAWHPDVLLSGLAMVIVIIVLIAWTG